MLVSHHVLWHGHVVHLTCWMIRILLRVYYILVLVRLSAILLSNKEANGVMLLQILSSFSSLIPGLQLVLHKTHSLMKVDSKQITCIYQAVLVLPLTWRPKILMRSMWSNELGKMTANMYMMKSWSIIEGRSAMVRSLSERWSMDNFYSRKLLPRSILPS